MANSLNKPLEELEDIPEIPCYYRHVWEWFLDLNQARSNSGFGVMPISYQSIDAYFRVMSIEVERDDIKALKVLDSLYLEAVNS